MLAVRKRVLDSGLGLHGVPPPSVVLMHALGFKRLGEAASLDPNLRGEHRDGRWCSLFRSTAPLRSLSTDLLTRAAGILCPAWERFKFVYNVLPS